MHVGQAFMPVSANETGFGCLEPPFVSSQDTLMKWQGHPGPQARCGRRAGKLIGRSPQSGG